MPRKKLKSSTNSKAKPVAFGKASVVREAGPDRFNNRFELMLADFERAVSKFEEVLARPCGDDDIVRDSALQRFEFSVELAWKTTRVYLIENLKLEMKPASAPNSLSSPKGVIREAFVQGLIGDEPFWLKMLDNRNLLSHVYNEKAAEAIFPTLPKAFSLCRDLLKALKERRYD